MNMSSKYLFSIIIPTRQRHDTLRFSIQSVINQTYTNFELIVMDNYSSPETYEVVTSFGDERIKYYRSEERLSMADNWELGLSYATGDYVFILGDDDALMPDGIELGSNLINKFDVDIVSWFRHQYWWPSVIVPHQRNKLFLNLLPVAEIWESRQKLREFYSSQCIFENLPMIYNSFVNRNLINTVKSIHGRYFMTINPDVESGIVNAYFSQKYLYSLRSLSIAGLSGHSTGTSSGYSSFNRQALNQFNKECEDNPSLKVHEILTPTVSNQEIYVADTSLKLKELYFPDDTDIQLDIKGLLNLIASRINRDTEQYETTLEEIKNIAEKHKIDISEISIPPKNTNKREPYQGPIFSANGSLNTLVINCEQLGVSDVAHAATVCQALLPTQEFLRVKTSKTFLSYETQELDTVIKTSKIIIDGVFFQLYRTGIARVWQSLLEQWANTEFAAHIIVLDRVNTAPKIPGISYRAISAYSYNNTDTDKQMLQQVCDEEGADLFISTYYTTPISTPSVFMAYDMIPEVLGGNLNEPMWREKHHAISHASSYTSISESTARDLVKFFPDITPDEVTVAHCGVAPTFTPATAVEISAFKHKYGISKPYFLLVGAGGNYKNAILFFRSFAQLQSKQGFEIVCTGSGVTLANEYREYASGSVVHSLILSDEELKVAYSGAVALVYPSLYEGFGMPVAEALACGCPVITCANASIPEVAGEAAIYVDANDVEGLTDALCEVQKLKVRNSLIASGLEQVKKFSWEKMADVISATLIKATLGRLNLREINLIIFPDWTQAEETVGLELQAVIKSLVTHPEKAKMSLLIDNSNITAEDADLILSSVAMNLLMEEELEVGEGPEIVLIGELSQMQWSALITQLQGRIKLEHENEGLIAQLQAEKIALIQLDI